jgi:hypothetical protein
VTPDERDYMTAREFAALPAAAHHVVWAAADHGLIDTIPAGGGGIRRWHRAQVRELLNPSPEEDGR